MRFLPLFEIRLQHAYYTRGPCPDFKLEPTADGERLARNHRLLVKEQPGGIVVLAAIKSDQSPEIPFEAGATMPFHLRSTNYELSLFTDLSSHQSMAAPLYSNAGIDSGQGGDLFLIDQPGTSLDPGVFADVEIHDLDAMAPSSAPAVFTISLAARAARWAYYVVTNIDSGSIELIDNDPEAGAALLRFDDDNNPRDLVAHPDPNDPIAVDLESRYPGLRRLRFVTREVIPCLQTPRKHLELHLDGMRRAGALPNPVFDNYSRIEVAVASTLQSQPSLFRIIKHITQPFFTI